MPRLTHGTVTATIAVEGAWVEELTDSASDIFFPKTLLRSENGDVKARGGMHVCLPNFGAGGDSGLPQHGFGRTATWNATVVHGSSVELGLSGGTVHYDRMESSLTYRLGNQRFEAVLTVTNHGARPLRVAPAFHPYFALDELETAVKVNGITYELSELAGTEFVVADHVQLVTAKRTFELSQTGLSTWAIWTDRLGPYVCVEPTFGGYRFLAPEQTDELLAPTEATTYSMHIAW